MRRFYFLTVLAVMACMVSGCANYAKDYAKNTLIVKNNHSLVEIAVEDYKGMSVTAEDLKAYVEDQVADYNEANEKGAVKMITMDTEDMSNAKLVLSYKNVESYNGFNLLECTLDDVSNVEPNRLEGSYTSADGENVSYRDLADVEDAKVLILSEKTDVVLRGEILYYNKEVTVEDGIATCSGEDNAVIIFK